MKYVVTVANSTHTTMDRLGPFDSPESAYTAAYAHYLQLPRPADVPAEMRTVKYDGLDARLAYYVGVGSGCGYFVGPEHLNPGVRYEAQFVPKEGLNVPGVLFGNWDTLDAAKGTCVKHAAFLSHAAMTPPPMPWVEGESNGVHMATNELGTFTIREFHAR